MVRHLEADFIKSAKLGDLIEVKSEMIELKNASLILKQEVWRDDVKLFAMTSTLAYVKEGKPSKSMKRQKPFLKALCISFRE